MKRTPPGALPLRDLLDRDLTTAGARAMGLAEAAAAEAGETIARCAHLLRSRGSALDGPASALVVPGRIEFLGKHTDYAGGRSLLCAVDRGIRLVVAPRPDHAVRVHDVRSGERVEFELAPSLSPRPGHWSNYPMTVARRITRNFPGPLLGAEIAFAGNLPRAAGMSSSSALTVAVFLALATVNDLPARPEYGRAIRSREELAGYLGTVENGQSFPGLPGDRGVGTFGGSEDHTAILCGRAGSLVQYSFCPVRFERALALPAGYGLVVASSGIVAEKTGSALERYNAVSEKARAVAELWRRETGRDDSTIAAALESGADAAGRIRSILRRARHEHFERGELLDRFEQFLAESVVIVPAAADALASGDLARLGEQVDRSQAEAERRLGNQTPETSFLARSARELGAAAASAFGAGFGGSVWALVGDAAAEDFRAHWAEAYRGRFPQVAGAEFLPVRAGPAAAALAP